MFVSIKDMKKYAPILLRISMAVVIIWFGISQLSDPNSWLGFLPSWTTSLPINQIQLIYLNGWFEVSFGFLLFCGFYTRFVSLLLFLHLLDITYTVGYNAIGVRDIGLALATISVFLFGSDSWSIDKLFERRNGSGRTDFVTSDSDIFGIKQPSVLLKQKLTDMKYGVGNKER